MSSIAQTTPQPINVSHLDRFGLTIFFALAMHAIIILGVSFDLFEDSANDALTTMEITLVHNTSEEEPDEADYLAQANQIGGGDREQKVRDSSPFSNTTPTQERGIAPDSQRDLAVPPVKQKQLEEELLTVEESPRQVASKEQEIPMPVPKKKITAAQLFERSQEIARLSAKIEEVKKAYAVTPRQTYVRGANAKQYRFASYMDAWRIKIEKYGTLNYPEEAARKGINGKLLLDVAIDKDGKLVSARVLRSSGYELLDKAAIRIVRLAAPYPPLTDAILEDTDILHIPRVWHFNSGGLSTQVSK